MLFIALATLAYGLAILLWLKQGIKARRARAEYLREHPDGYYYGGEEPGLWLFLGLFIASLVTWLTPLIVASSINKQVTFHQETTRQVVSLQDNAGTSGSVHGGGSFLGFFVSGQQNGSIFYSWYEREGSGPGFRGRSITDNNANDVRVVQIPRSHSPRVVHETWNSDTRTDSWVAPFNMNASEAPYWRDNWTLYVPRGTIVRQYRLNAK